MEEKLTSKKALITGAAKRIGRQIALSLAAEGAEIVIHYNTSQNEAEDFKAELTRKGVKAWTIKADFEIADELETLIARTIKMAGSLDILINSASIFTPATMQEMDFENIMRNMRINAWVPFLLSRNFARLAGKGQIVNILDSRINGYDFGHVPYYLSKQVFSLLTKMCALEFAPSITVNAVSPGVILAPSGKDHGYLEKLAKKIPLEKYGAPTDVAQAVVYLLKNSFITGQVINVDGGMHLKENINGPHNYS